MLTTISATANLKDVIQRAEKIRREMKASAAHFVSRKFTCPVHGTYTCHAREGELVTDHGCPKCREERAKLAQRKNDHKLAFRNVRAELFKELQARPCYAGRNTFDTFEAATTAQKRNVEICKRFASRLFERIFTLPPEKSSVGLCLCGKPGTGKTHLGSAIYNALEEEGLAPVYLRASTFFNCFLGMDGATINKISAYFSRVSCLMLDELGRTACSAYEANRILEILDERMRFGRPTVFITNLDKSALRSGLGDAIASRAASAFYTLSFDGEDYRKKAGLPADPLDLF